MKRLLTWCLLLAGLIATCVALPACGGDIEAGIESANELLYRKEYVESERLYLKLLRRIEAEEPHLSEEEDNQRRFILDRLGKLNALYLHDYDAAIKFYKQLTVMYPRSDQAFTGLATIADILQHKLGRHEAAIEAYQKMVEEFPTTGDMDAEAARIRAQEQRRAQLKVTNAYFQLKNYEQARTEAETLISRWPKTAESAQARFLIANSYYLQGRFAEAVATYEQLLEQEPQPQLTSLVLFELANCFQELNEDQRALAYYYACLADHPDPLLVQRKLKRLRKRIGRAKPSDSIHIPGYLKDRLAAVRSLPFGVKTTPPPAQKTSGTDDGGSAKTQSTAAPVKKPQAAEKKRAPRPEADETSAGNTNNVAASEDDAEILEPKPKVEPAPAEDDEPKAAKPVPSPETAPPAKPVPKPAPAPPPTPDDSADGAESP